MIIMKKIRLLPFLMLLTFTALSQPFNISVEEGIVKFVFSKDTIGINRYWLMKKEFNGHYLVEDIQNIIGDLYVFCDSLSLEYKVKKSLYQLKEYQAQNLGAHDYDTHFGGDIFFDNENHLVISFYIKAQVIRLYKPPCTYIHFQNNYSCPVETDKVSYPVVVIVNILKSRSLSKHEKGKRGYQPYQKNSFPAGFCH